MELVVESSLEVTENSLGESQVRSVGGCAVASKDADTVGDVGACADHGVHDLADNLAVQSVMRCVEGLGLVVSRDESVDGVFGERGLLGFGVLHLELDQEGFHVVLLAKSDTRWGLVDSDAKAKGCWRVFATKSLP